MVIVREGVVVALWASDGLATTARIAKRPMWLVFQTAAKEPSDWIVVVSVEVQRHRVWCPYRSISIVSPASRLGAVPEKARPLRRIAEALVWSVIPLPAALTLAFPLWTDAGWLALAPLEPDPPEDAQPLAGNASAAHAIANTA
jgi:hypothetical protein